MKTNRRKVIGFSLIAAMILSAVPFQVLQAEDAAENEETGEAVYEEFELMPNSVSIQSYSSDEGRVDVYGSFTELVNEYGTVREMDGSMLLMKRGEIVPVSTQFEFIHERPDQVLVDTITGSGEKAQYLSVLTERRVLEDYYKELSWPKELSNVGIAEISNSLDSSDSVVMVRYTDNTVAAFNYVTGNLLFLDESEKESIGFGEYVQNWLTETMNKLFPDENTGYEESRIVLADAGLLAEADRENAVWKGGSGEPDGLLQVSEGQKGFSNGMTGISGELQGIAEESSEHQLFQVEPGNITSVSAAIADGLEAGQEDLMEGDLSALDGALELNGVSGPNGAWNLNGASGLSADDAEVQGTPFEAFDGDAELVTADGQIISVAEYMETYGVEGTENDIPAETPGTAESAEPTDSIESAEPGTSVESAVFMDLENASEERVLPESDDVSDGTWEAAASSGADMSGEGELAKASAADYLTVYDPLTDSYEVYELSEYLQKAGDDTLQSVGDKLGAMAGAGTYNPLSQSKGMNTYSGRGWAFVLAVFGCILFLLGGLLWGSGKAYGRYGQHKIRIKKWRAGKRDH